MYYITLYTHKNTIIQYINIQVFHTYSSIELPWFLLFIILIIRYL